MHTYLEKKTESFSVEKSYIDYLIGWNNNNFLIDCIHILELLLCEINIFSTFDIELSRNYLSASII